MKFIDFFSGVGGFTRGLELAGHECIGHCEFDKFAEASYRAMHTATAEQLKGWRKEHRSTTAECSRRRIETLYMNY